MRISDWSSDVCSSDLGLFDRDEALIVIMVRCCATIGLRLLIPRIGIGRGVIRSDAVCLINRFDAFFRIYLFVGGVGHILRTRVCCSGIAQTIDEVIEWRVLIEAVGEGVGAV